MKKILFLLFITFQLSVFSQVEMKYNANTENLPTWVQLMYADNPDEGAVINTYTNFYKKNELVKNKHTQYYKRWLRGISRFSNAKPTLKTSKSSNQWECVGPWDFDKDAASRSYAPGAAHVYTVEQAVSNPNVLYAGSATAGAWKTTDKGANWELITRYLDIGGVYAIEIDFTNPDIVYISPFGGIYKSYDGGANWTVIGDAAFINLSPGISDMKLKPSNNLELFVASDEGTAPSDAFSRMILLKSDNAVGVEVITYLVILFLLAGCWLLAIRRKNLPSSNNKHGSQIFLIPVFGAFLAIFIGADLYSFVPDYLFPLSLLSFIAVDYLMDREKEIETTGWTFYSHKYFPTIVIVTLVSFFLTQQVFFVMLFLLFFIPMHYSKNASSEWIWATFGVMLCLAAAWASLIEVIYAGILLLIFIAPWLLEKYEEQENSFSLFSRKWQQIIALWGSVLVVSTYLILTLVILIGSIDSVNFEAHELYGAPFILAFSISMMLYLNRKNDPKRTFNLLSTLVILSIILAVFFPHALGADSDSSISSMIDRGAVAWIYLPILLICIAPLVSEIRSQAMAKKSTPLLKRIPLAAHIVHLGLVLLIIGHVSTTLLVDRGDASHRITLIKDEIVIDNGYGFQFNEAIATSENLEVGDGYVGIDISVYEVNDGVVGDKIGDVEPGMLRFDKTGTARSEIDIMTRWSGDIVFIFDGTQADSLMKQSQIEGLESIELVRVTVYDLPASHLVWLGWATMMIGMTMITYASSHKKEPLKAQDSSISEQE